MPRSLSLLLPLAVACGAPPPAVEAEGTLIAETPSCPECDITHEVIAELSGPPEALVEWPQSAWRDSQGRIFIAQPNKPIPPAVFGADGRFLQFLGREGEGPGEFRHAAHITIDATDSVVVLDWGSQRVSILGPDLEFVRSLPAGLGGGNDLAVLEGGAIAVAGPVIEGPARRRPIKLTDRMGEQPEVLGPTRVRQADNAYFLAAARGGGLWAVRRYSDLRIAHFLPGGETTWFRRAPDWLDVAPASVEWPDLNAMSSVRAIWEDAEGLLWLVTTVPTRKSDVAMDTLRSEGQSIPVPKNFDDAWDTVVDVIDLWAGQLVASARFPEYLMVAVGPDAMLHVLETDAGLRMTVVRFVLTRP